MNNNIGARLRALRNAKGFTTQEIADKVNVSQSYISRFENGRAIPNIDMLESILQALDTNLSTFFSEDLQEDSEDLIQLIDTVKTLSPEARVKLNDFLQIMKENNT